MVSDCFLSFWGNKNVLELDYGDDCKPVSKYKQTIEL